MNRTIITIAQLFVVTALLACVSVQAQLGNYSSCDTIIQGVTYNRCLYLPEQGLKSLAYVDSRGQLDGGWIEYGVGDSTSLNVTGQYHKGKKDGEWVFRNQAGEFIRSENYVEGIPCGKWWTSRREFIELDKDGNVIAKGTGCRDCPKF
jgi:hypothetical protein